MIRYIVSRSRDESGFSLIELVMYMLILAIMIGTATYFFISVRDVNSLNNASQEVRAAMERGQNMSVAQNQNVTLTFYGPGTLHPNTYSYVKADGTSEKPPLGSAYFTEGAVYYIKLQQGDSGLTIASTVSILYSAQGTLMTVTPGTVTVSRSGRTKSVTINSNGEIN